MGEEKQNTNRFEVNYDAVKEHPSLIMKKILNDDDLNDILIKYHSEYSSDKLEMGTEYNKRLEEILFAEGFVLCEGQF